MFDQSERKRGGTNQIGDILFLPSSSALVPRPGSIAKLYAFRYSPYELGFALGPA